MQHYAFHIGDYSKATSHLSPMEDIAYRRLIDLYYDTEGHIPYEVAKAARRVRLDADPVGQVLQEFFIDTGSEWKHSRCDAEMEKIYEKSDKARESGKRSGEVRRAKAQQTIIDGSTDAERTLNERSTDAELPVTRYPLPVTQESTALSGKPDVVQLSNGKSKFKGDAEIILAFLNEKAQKRFPTTKANLDFIAGRLQEGATVADCRQVIAMKVREWAGDVENRKYLRPATLFNATKFSQYVGELGSPT